MRSYGVLLLSVSAAITGCGAPRVSAPAESTQAPVQSTEAPTEEAPPPQSWTHLAVVSQWPIAAEFETRGHLVAHPKTRIRVSPGSESTYANWSRGRQMEAGVVLVAEFVDPDGNIAEWFSMERGENGWRYDVIEPRGQLADAPPTCANCHRQATSDEVFGLAR